MQPYNVLVLFAKPAFYQVCLLRSNCDHIYSNGFINVCDLSFLINQLKSGFYENRTRIAVRILNWPESEDGNLIGPV